MPEPTRPDITYFPDGGDMPRSMPDLLDQVRLDAIEQAREYSLG